MVINVSKPYYCAKCGHKHYRGQVYKDHLKHKVIQRGDDIPSESFVPLGEKEWNALLGNQLAWKQLLRLFKKYIQASDKSLYTGEINKLLLQELR